MAIAFCVLAMSNSTVSYFSFLSSPSLSLLSFPSLSLSLSLVVVFSRSTLLYLLPLAEISSVSNSANDHLYSSFFLSPPPPCPICCIRSSHHRFYLSPRYGESLIPFLSISTHTLPTHHTSQWVAVSAKTTKKVATVMKTLRASCAATACRCATKSRCCCLVTYLFYAHSHFNALTFDDIFSLILIFL